MTDVPCVCPKDSTGHRVHTDPRCFDHAEWNRHPSTYTVVLKRPKPSPVKRAAALVAGAALPLGLGVTATPPAQAAPTPQAAACQFVTVYNVIDSDNYVKVHDVNAANTDVWPGQTRQGHYRTVYVWPGHDLDIWNVTSTGAHVSKATLHNTGWYRLARWDCPQVPMKTGMKMRDT